MEKICLFVIDPQRDFLEGGNLAVKGATRDMDNLTKLVKNHGRDLDGIEITLDSHYPVHIAHTRSWVDAFGNHPTPFTDILDEAVDEGKWKAFNPGFQKRYKAYTAALKANGRYVLKMWPDHCIIGSDGQKIYPPLYDVIYEWESTQYGIATRTTKGSNPFTEHYSAVKADVEDPKDVSTRLNERIIRTLKKYDIILIAGEALSHCVANTIMDVANEFSTDQIKKFVLLEDATSSVETCEKMGEDFVNAMVKKGMRLSKTTNFF
jgi:nicotinamidase/pyrazinamidase